MRTLVTGGVRSGKSVVAEGLFPLDAEVCYVATGPARDDPDWAARVRGHRERRPAPWSTVETGDLSGVDLSEVLRAANTPLLIDCLGTWLTAVLDGLAAWDAPESAWVEALEARCAAVLEALRACEQTVVLVSNEVGWGLVSEHRSGRIFADRLGRLNQAVAAECDRVLLVVAGRVLEL